MAEVFYRSAAEFKSEGAITITATNQPFFAYFAGQSRINAGQTFKQGTNRFDDLINALLGWGDAFMRRIKYHTPLGGNLAEQFNRDTGVPQGAADLTWSYAALLTAALARAEVDGDGEYGRHLADLSW